MKKREQHIRGDGKAVYVHLGLHPIEEGGFAKLAVAGKPGKSAVAKHEYTFQLTPVLASNESSKV